jgi:hypothetical protein
MDIISYSRHLATSIEKLIIQSGKTKQSVSLDAGIAWATFSRRLAHPENSFFTVTEIISICSALQKDFISVLQDAEEPALADKGPES